MTLASANSDKREGVEVVSYEKGVDEAVDLVTGHDPDEFVSPKDARYIRNKIDFVILPLLFAVYIVQFIDKFGCPVERSTIGASAVLGIIEDNRLTADQFNTLGSAFYIGYIIFAYPHSWALQRFPAAKYLAANIFIWAILIGLHDLCSSFGGLFAIRFLLGASEGCITNGVMLVTSMFYNRTEIGERIGWTLQCNGVATIISGFVAYGVAHSSPTRKPARWQLLMIVYAGITLFIGVWFLLVFPDNPVKAKFLTEHEKVQAIKRIQTNQSGIETKTWKREQVVEALKDVKTWLFFFLAAISNLQNGYGLQYSLIIQSFGFTTIQTTALNIPTGVAQILGTLLATFILHKFPNSRCWIAVVFFVPSVVAEILLMTLPWANRAGLLVAFYIFSFGGAPSWAMIISWVTVTTAGHTKKLTVNAMLLMGYALGQVLCTQFWRDQYKPRNYVPWSICLTSHMCDFALLLTIRYVLVKENKRRDSLGVIDEQEQFGFVERLDGQGQLVRQKVDKGLLDLTDRQNLSFRYAL